jgi:hypothetical protein
MKTLYITSIISLVLLTVSCKQKNSLETNKPIEITSKELLQKAMDAHGGEQAFKSSSIDFKIEQTAFNLQYDENGRADFKQIRQLNSETHELSYKYGLIQYTINDSVQPDDAYSKRMAEISLFGFLYTFSIPFNLTTNDVIISKQPNVTIRQKEYYTLDVQYTKIPDLPEDRFLLYINVDSYEIEYVALEHDLSGSKPQFRRMTNPKKIEGLLFQDYILFHRNDTITPLEKFYTKYNQSDLKGVRTIQFDSISVKKRP